MNDQPTNEPRNLNPDQMRSWRNHLAAYDEYLLCTEKASRARTPHNRQMWTARASRSLKMANAHLDDIARIAAKAATTIALAAFLAITQIPAGCTLTGHTSEGFPVATCDDGTTVYQDLDGQPYQNAAGNPVYPAGTWVEMQ